MLFPEGRLSTRRQNTGAIILQISLSLRLKSQYEVVITGKKKQQKNQEISSL
jgi:hypothetical protein